MVSFFLSLKANLLARELQILPIPGFVRLLPFFAPHFTIGEPRVNSWPTRGLLLVNNDRSIIARLKAFNLSPYFGHDLQSFAAARMPNLRSN